MARRNRDEDDLLMEEDELTAAFLGDDDVPQRKTIKLLLPVRSQPSQMKSGMKKKTCRANWQLTSTRRKNGSWSRHARPVLTRTSWT